MGGGLGIHVAVRSGSESTATRDAARAADRVRAWARLLTRHDPTSDLMRFNANPDPRVSVGLTLARVLEWADDARRLTGGVVDATLLDARLAAEAGSEEPAQPFDRRWRLARTPRGAVVERAPGLHIDLDGVAKGWLADRALALLDGHEGAVVDADGDIAIRVAPADAWEIGVGDPRDAEMLLAVLRFERASAGPDGRLGVATSGISVHSWPDAKGGPGSANGPSEDGADSRAGDGAGLGAQVGRHHLIDPRTGRPAQTDVVQATVIASSAAVAEAWAKTAVILGGAAALDRLEHAAVRGAILLLRDGRTVAIPRTTRYLA